MKKTAGLPMPQSGYPKLPLMDTHILADEIQIKLDNGGNPLPDAAISWGMIEDKETGLIWEVKQNKDGSAKYDDPNDADNSYTLGDINNRFKDLMNSSRYAGYSDWRIPTIEELKTLVDSNFSKPAINTVYFPNTQSALYWSSSPHFTVDSSWCVDFLFGGIGYGIFNDRSGTLHYNDSRYVRAVRGGQ